MMTRSLIRIAAIGAAASLVLTACSDADEDDSSASATSASATSSSAEETAESESESKVESDSEESSSAAGEEENTPGDKPAREEPRDEQAAPDKPGDDTPVVPERQPDQRSAKSDEEDVRGLVEGIRDHSDSYGQYMRYLRANSCKKDVATLGDANELDKFVESMMDAGLGYVPKLHKINSINVDGNRASVHVDATVTSGPNGEEVPQAGDMNLLNEDGRWKFCGV